MSFSPLITKALGPAGLVYTRKRRAEFFGRLERLCPLVALQARLMDAFGLAVHEVVDLQPAKADAGDRLVLTDASGGRVVAIETRHQRELLDAAKAAADDEGLLRPMAGRDSRQICRRLRFLIAAAAERRVLLDEPQTPHCATPPADLFTNRGGRAGRDEPRRPVVSPAPGVRGSIHVSSQATQKEQHHDFTPGVRKEK